MPLPKWPQQGSRVASAGLKGGISIGGGCGPAAPPRSDAPRPAPLPQAPPELRRATTPAELAALMPSSYPIARFRRRSIEARGIQVSYKPLPGEVLGAPPAAHAAGASSEVAAASAAGDMPVATRAPSDSYLEVGRAGAAGGGAALSVAVRVYSRACWAQG
jgi:hypothetical protein